MMQLELESLFCRLASAVQNKWNTQIDPNTNTIFSIVPIDDEVVLEVTLESRNLILTLHDGGVIKPFRLVIETQFLRDMGVDE